MRKELPKIYEPQKFEDKIYHRWEKSGFFNPENSKGINGNYCNVLPPPNANGELHVGHASGYTVMDIFGRYARMNGKKTLLLPGKDHAGIQTQVVFEKILKKETGKTRQEFGRKEFYKRTYDFCINRSDYMRSQEKKIGISACWTREKFTLDPDVLKIALDTFVKMYNDGLIYKGKRIINWCPRCATALSDVEVHHKETAGKLYYIKYPLENSADFVTVATTRPETMLGDTAVAVGLDDERYSTLIGKNLLLPLQNRIIPIIADNRIDTKFATGAVKITPAHDPLDWQIGKDHKLAEIQIIDEQAIITELGGKYKGLSTLTARKQIIEDLQKLGFLEKIEEMTHSISICERCKTTIEPLTSNQWFISVEKLKAKAISTIENNEIEIFPNNFKKILIDWFENLHDWCISRQIWWGPQFPVWYCKNCGQEKNIVSLEKPKACPHCKGKELSQDENTFDTWFTSGQWAYTTLKSKKDDYKNFYPSEMMIMGRDLLFFWASRMIMLSLYTTGQVPFKNLFFTGLVKDKDGHKFSKSRGNGIDPLVAIDKFGSDALRMSLIMDSAPGQDSRLYEEKIKTFRNFANKLWNISRFCLTQEDFKLIENIKKEDLTSAADNYVIAKLYKVTREINRLFEGRQIAVAADVLKSFTWDILADDYIEWHKIGKNTKLLGYLLDKTLRLWHPFMPFITEHVWELANKKEALIVSKWPTSQENFESTLSNNFEITLQIITYINNIRAEYKMGKTSKTNLFLDENAKNILSAAEILFIQKRAGVSEIKFNQTKEEHLKRVLPGFNIYIPLKGLIDTEKEKARLKKEIIVIENFVAGLSARLGDKNFVSKAPEQIIAQQKETLAKKEVELTELKKHLASLD